MAAERAERLYRFEPLDTSGVFLGLGLVQCVALGGGLLVGVAAVTTGSPLAAAVIPPILGCGIAFGRVRGQRVWEVALIGVMWTWRRVRHGRRWTAPLPLIPTPAGEAAALPSWLAGLDIVEVPWRGSIVIGAVRDRERHTLTSLVRVSGPQFVVHPRPDQERLLASWGDVLNQFAVERGAVVHVTWSDFAQHSGLDKHRAWLVNLERGEPNSAAEESYRELLGAASDLATTHDVVVSITVARDRMAKRHRDDDSAEVALERMSVSATESLLRALRSAGLSADSPLAAGEIHRLLRTRIEPASTRPRSVGGNLVDRVGLDSPVGAQPLAADADWGQLRLDGSWHRTWWVEVWPRLAVPPSWLEGFLSAGGVTRAVTVVFCPVPAHQSRRRIERDLVKLETDASTKEEKGRRVDARHRRATQALLDREQELVAGFAEMGYVGLVTVTATSLEQLEDHAELVEQLARESGMELRVLHGRQDLGWAAALPIGLAPKSLVA